MLDSSVLSLGCEENANYLRLGLIWLLGKVRNFTETLGYTAC